ncbi:tyrosine-type recombinase/integrase [Algibacter pacificus]|uniref:tyrosine-type recombinase/integrase n=1 Tax=Algibacter pacificus TaxID=2599389 RepID=UPI0011CABFBD|nr:site-specific integrase [Algibacter pacificus]
MSSIFLLLQKVHENVHDFPMKVNFSDPKIYTGGVDIRSWSKLTKKEKKSALAKPWYVYYSFRNPKTNRLERQTNIKGGVNKYTDKRSRHHILKMMVKSLSIVLEEGFNPYQDNSELTDYLKRRLEGKQESTNKKPNEVHAPVLSIEPTVVPIQESSISIGEAFELALSLKSKVLNPNSFVKFRSRITRFKKWLDLNDIKGGKSMTLINKKTVIQYLNDVLLNSSPRNRNNTRTDLASFYQILEDNEVIQENFVKKINVLKAKPERNKTYTPKQQADIFRYMKEEDPLLLLFVKFVCYNFLRPIEVCRLKIGDIDLVDKKLYVKAKNQPVKIKIIPNILIKEIPDLSSFSKDDFLFTDTQIGGAWETTETNKRDFYTKKYKKVKDHFGLGVNYGLYSFRHTFITKLYREMAKTASPFEVKSKLQLITGHSTMKALEQYLRDIDAALPNDYSKLLN